MSPSGTSVIPAWWTWITLAVLAALSIYLRPRQKHRRLPPGPPQLPLIGNVLDFPRRHLGQDFQRLSQRYGTSSPRVPNYDRVETKPSLWTSGDIVYLNALEQPMLLLGSYKVARELLDKRSANYSDRPDSVMAKLYVLSGPHNLPG